MEEIPQIIMQFAPPVETQMDKHIESPQSVKSAKELGAPSIDRERRSSSVSRWLSKKGKASDDKPVETKPSIKKFSYVFDTKEKEGKIGSKIGAWQEMINKNEKIKNSVVTRPTNGPKPAFSKTMRNSISSRDAIQSSPTAAIVTSVTIQPKQEILNVTPGETLKTLETPSKSKPSTATKYGGRGSADPLLASGDSSAVSLQQSTDGVYGTETGNSSGEDSPPATNGPPRDAKFPITVRIITNEVKDITVSVSHATSVEELLDSLLQMGLTATNRDDCDDEDEEWGISVDDNSNEVTGGFLPLTDRPFSPCDTGKIYTLRAIIDGRARRQNKLGSILGISDENILQSIRETTARETEDYNNNKAKIGLTTNSKSKSGQELNKTPLLRNLSKSDDGITEIRSEGENHRRPSLTGSLPSPSLLGMLPERHDRLETNEVDGSGKVSQRQQKTGEHVLQDEETFAVGEESLNGHSVQNLEPGLSPSGGNEFKKGRPIVISKSSKALSLLGVVRASELEKDEAGGLSPSSANLKFNRSASFGARAIQPSFERPAEISNRRASSDASLDNSTTDLSMQDLTRKKETYKRAGKLVDFFGVHHQKEVEEIRKTLKLEYNEASPIRRRIAYLQDTAGQSLLRVYFGNETYKSLAVTTTTTAVEVVSMLLNKIRVKDNAELYGLFQSSTDGIHRQLGPQEIPFEVMRSWEGNEVFLFKKLATNADEKHKLPTGKRAAKLAGFFGVTQEANQSEPPPEFTELLEVLNEGGNDSGLVREIANSNQRTVKINSAGDVSKEGWLILVKDAAAPESGETCWCEINNCSLLLQTNQSKDTSVAPNADAEFRFALDQCVIENPTKVSGSYTFRILTTRTNVEKIFRAPSLTEAEGWVNALQTAVRKAKNTMSIADFEFHRVLGKGQFGKVLLCSQRSTGNVYAIKVLSKRMMAKEEGGSVGDNVILEGIKHPFIVTLHCACETEDRLYLVLEYVNGGEIFFHVSNFGQFSEERVRFYAAEIFLAMQYLHKNGIIYRDMKLENLMLSKEGHIKIADFGLSVRIGIPQLSNEKGIVGTTEYLAPEILSGKPHHFSGDWWAYGLVTFEMLCGYHPFYTEDRAELYDNIMHAPVEYPSDMSTAACNFLKGILCRNPKARLGCVPVRRKLGSVQNGTTTADDPSEAIRHHEFFKCIDFEKLYQKKIEPPFLPEILDDFDTRYFDECFLSEQPSSPSRIGEVRQGEDASNWSIFQNR